VIMHELEATEDTFLVCKQRRDLTTISRHHTTILNILKNFCHWKNRTTISLHRTTI